MSEREGTHQSKSGWWDWKHFLTTGGTCVPTVLCTAFEVTSIDDNIGSFHITSVFSFYTTSYNDSIGFLDLLSFGLIISLFFLISLYSPSGLYLYVDS